MKLGIEKSMAPHVRSFPPALLIVYSVVHTPNPKSNLDVPQSNESEKENTKVLYLGLSSYTTAIFS